MFSKPGRSKIKLAISFLLYSKIKSVIHQKMDISLIKNYTTFVVDE